MFLPSLPLQLTFGDLHIDIHPAVTTGIDLIFIGGKKTLATLATGIEWIDHVMKHDNCL